MKTTRGTEISQESRNAVIEEMRINKTKKKNRPTSRIQGMTSENT